MQRNDCAQSLGRLLALVSIPQTEVEPYITTVYEACGWMHSIRFEEVCKDIAGSMATGRRVGPGQFKAVYSRLADEKCWNKSDKVNRQPCGGCQDVGMVYIRMKREVDGKEDDFCEPCPVCQPHHPARNRPDRVGWIRLA